MRAKPWLIVTAVCVGLVVILGLSKFFQIKAAIEFGESFPEPSETVEAERLRLSDWRPTISVVGSLKAPRELQLRNEAAGMISKIGFESGAKVDAGQLLLQLDISEEQARLQAINAQIELARQNVKRISGLSNKSAVSKQQSDSFASQLTVAQAEAASVEELIANKTLIAPFAGTTGLHDFEVGEYLPTNTLVTQLVGNTDKLWVDFALPQQYTQFQLGTDIKLNNAGQKITARVTAVEPNISELSRSLRARAELDNSQSKLKPGSVINAIVPVGDTRKVFKLPSKAIRVDAFGSFVFALQADDKQQLRAIKKPVEVVTKEGDYSIVESGLEPDELIATKGSFKLREGLLVFQTEASQQIEASEPELENVE